MKKILIFILPVVVLLLTWCSKEVVEVEKEVYRDRYFYTWFTAEYKLWEKWYVFNDTTSSYDNVSICWYIFLTSDLSVWDYAYLVWKDWCSDYVDKYIAYRYKFKKILN